MKERGELREDELEPEDDYSSQDWFPSTYGNSINSTPLGTPSLTGQEVEDTNSMDRIEEPTNKKAKKEKEKKKKEKKKKEKKEKEKLEKLETSPPIKKIPPLKLSISKDNLFSPTSQFPSPFSTSVTPSSASFSPFQPPTTELQEPQETQETPLSPRDILQNFSPTNESGLTYFLIIFKFTLD